ncbi:PREDICTED: LOW QUALITY PROTEIN: olfactory receptor 9G9-like [Aptenodytes forsteri]|uniref:LOW QUALITY PROTEIN: olfactory receptor 9G9-like n=1 Tax=Aptenodytes forsteri TaxID=9233 RepID=UPI000904A061|nr:PREDICTED: LOW QUALITY PROTEIN: olfactory receptor 9G9-like [Aptenodytes forsteri]
MEERNHRSVTSFTLLRFTTDPKLQLLLFMVFTLAYVTTLVSNITLIMVICRSSRLHTPMYFFVGNLSFPCLWYSSVYTPKTLLNCVSEDKSISFAGCAAQFFVSGGLARGQSKAFSTCATHLTAVTLYYGSILFIYTRPSSTYVLGRDKVVSVFYTGMIPTLSPFIYSLRNQEVKEALKRLVKRQTAS